MRKAAGGQEGRHVLCKEQVWFRVGSGAAGFEHVEKRRRLPAEAVGRRGEPGGKVRLEKHGADIWGRVSCPLLANPPCVMETKLAQERGQQVLERKKTVGASRGGQWGASEDH